MKYDEIIEKVWDDWGDKKTIAVHMHRIRAAIKGGRDIPEVIQTVRNVGYKFVAEETAKEGAV